MNDKEFMRHSYRCPKCSMEMEKRIEGRYHVVSCPSQHATYKWAKSEETTKKRRK